MGRSCDGIDCQGRDSGSRNGFSGSMCCAGRRRQIRLATSADSDPRPHDGVRCADEDARMRHSFVSHISIPKQCGIHMTDSHLEPGTRPPLQHRIADAVRRRRKASNMSQEAFADHIAMHRVQYGLIERGIRDLRLSTLERVAQGLELPLSTILSDAEEADA